MNEKLQIDKVLKIFNEKPESVIYYFSNNDEYTLTKEKELYKLECWHYYNEFHVEPIFHEYSNDLLKLLTLIKEEDD